MEIIQIVAGVSIFIVVIALFLGFLERLAKRVGSKLIYLVIVFVVPLVIGISVVVLNYENLYWYEVIYIPLVGPVLVLGAAFIVLLHFNPEVLCIPFQYIYALFKRKNR